MDRKTRTGLKAVVTGTIAATVSAAALALLSRAGQHGAARPLNATSHWLHGEEAARLESPDLLHTGVGGLTHLGATIFWALPFEAWLERHPPRSSAGLLGSAVAMSAIAAAVDYGPTPRRYTPGWELALSKRSMVASYGALALGLAAGAAISARIPIDAPSRR